MSSHPHLHRAFCLKFKHLKFKIFPFRWWPAQIPMLSEVSDSFRNSKPTQFMFLVRFFSTNQYFWTHHGRVIMFTEECAVPKDSKSHRPVAENYVNGNASQSLVLSSNYYYFSFSRGSGCSEGEETED